MAEDGPAFTKRKLSSSIAPARRTSLEDAFDSNESEWSESDEEEKVLKPSSNKDKIDKYRDNLEVSSPAGDMNKGQIFEKDTLSLATVIESNLNPVVSTKEPLNNEKDNEDSKVLTVKVDVPSETKEKKDSKGFSSDDWDEDSEVGVVKQSVTIPTSVIGLPMPAKIPSVFQPQQSSSSQDVVEPAAEMSKSFRKQNPIVEWSPSESFAEDLSSMGEEQNEMFESDHENEEKMPERGDGDSIHKDAKAHQHVSSLFEAKVVDRIEAQKSQETKTSSSFEVDRIEDAPKLKENAFTETIPSTSAQPAPSTSSAAHLFSAVKPSAGTTQRSQKMNKNAESIETDRIEKGTTRKRSKSTSSGKGFFSRLLSSENAKPSKKDAAERTFARKSSEPAPLSTLLLNTPIKSLGGGERKKGKDLSIPQATTTTTAKRSRSRASSGPAETDQSRPKDALTVPSGSGRQKTLMGKIKKTFGVRSKPHLTTDGISRSTLSVPNALIKGATSDPYINTGEIETPIIAIQTKGRPIEDVLVELLKEAKTFVENATSQNDPLNLAGGDAYLFVSPRDHDSGGNLRRSEKSLDELGHTDERNRETDTGNMSFYCSQAEENGANRHVVQSLMEDFMCVVNKSFGTNEKLKNDCSALLAEIERLRAELDAAVCARLEAERKIQELIHHNTQLQYCLEEECQARQNLEDLVKELKAQINRQDECLNAEALEKADLLARLRQLEVDLQNCRNQVSDFEAERDEMFRNMKGLEGSRGKCGDLQQALAECCEQCDNLQKELFDLRQAYREMEGKLDRCMFENSQLCKQLECCKQKNAEDRALLEGEICKLRETIAALERNKVEVCQKMNDILKQHHEEMDKLRTEADIYKCQLEDMRKLKDDLEKRLRDCEEQKKKNGVDQTQANKCYEEAAKLIAKCDAERISREGAERKLKESEEKMQKVVAQQRQVLEQQLEDNEKISRAKIEGLKIELETAKMSHLEEQKQRENTERKLKEAEEKLLRSSHGQELEQQKQEFHSQQIQQKLDRLQREVEKYKGMHNDEKRFREDAERKLKDLEDQKNRNITEQQLTLQLHSQQQELLSTQSQEIEKYKAINDEEKRARQELEQKLRILEDEKLRNLQDHQISIHHIQQQQEFHSQQKVELFKTEIEKYKLMFDEEKRMREELDRKLRNAEEQNHKNATEHQEALRKQQEYYSKLASAAKQQTEEEKVARELWQRELRDAQRLWESEVKAKGILAEKLARFEKQHMAVEAQTKREQEELERYREKIRYLKAALKNEKDLVVKVTNKLDDTRTLAKNYKSQIDEVMKDPKTQKLMALIENLKLQFETQTDSARKEKEKLMGEIYKLDQEKWKAERAARKLSEDVKIMEAEMSTWKNLAKMKDHMEIELVELKRAISDQFVDKRDMEKLKNAYEGKLAEIKTHYEKEVQLQVTETLSQLTTQIGRQTRDRNMLEKIRDVNENTLRTELSSVTRSMQVDIDKLKGIIRERDEQIVSLRKSLEIVKDKYAHESRQRDCLVKRLQVLSSPSQEALVYNNSLHPPPLIDAKESTSGCTLNNKDNIV